MSVPDLDRLFKQYTNDGTSTHPVDVDLSSTDCTFTAPYPRALRIVGAGDVDLIGSGDSTNSGAGTHVVIPCADGEILPISPKKVIKATTTVTRVIALY